MTGVIRLAKERRQSEWKRRMRKQEGEGRWGKEGCCERVSRRGWSRIESRIRNIEINAISFTIYRRGGQPQVFIAMHYEINKVLLNLLSEAVTPPALVDGLGTGKFALDWQKFVQMLDVYQRTDAYIRYLRWGRKPILKRPREEDVGAAAVGNLDQATILQLLRPPPLKKPKS
ncbi:hypothetical protein K438DRAFT_1791579 [Mycena galopus ATCC 62051]|nr:hypothetical protein K438DRAFT_1791579 [Mycena galopus ATCC 62051]